MSKSYDRDSWQGILLITVRDLIFAILIGAALFAILYFGDL